MLARTKSGAELGLTHTRVHTHTHNLTLSTYTMHTVIYYERLVRIES